MDERVDVEEARARADVEVGAVRRKVGLRLVGPQRVEALAEDVVANRLPEPACGLGVRGVDVGAGAVVGEAVDRGAVGEVREPAVLQQQVVVARVLREARPDADHRLEAHVVELPVHRRGVGPPLGDEVHLAHARVVEPVDDHHVGGEAAVAVALRDPQHLVLARVALLALDVAVRRLRQQRRLAGEPSVAAVDLVGRRPGDHEEGDAVADLGDPPGALAHPRLDACLRGVVPHEPVAVVRDHERHADARPARGEVVVPARERVAAVVEEALLVLAEPVVVLVVGRREGGADLEEGRVGGAAVGEDRGVAVLVVRHRHLPADQVQERPALRCRERDVGRGRRAVEEPGDVHLRVERLSRIVQCHRDDESRRAIDVALGARLVRPASGLGRRHEPVARPGQRFLPVEAERHAHHVRRVRFQRDRAPVALERDGLGRCRRRGQSQWQHQVHGLHFAPPCRAKCMRNPGAWGTPPGTGTQSTHWLPSLAVRLLGPAPPDKLSGS